MSRFSLFPATFLYGSGGATALNLTQLHSLGIRPDAQNDQVVPAGALTSGANILMSANPALTFGSHDLASLVGVVSPTAGLDCTGGGVFRLQRRLNNSTFYTGGQHITLTSTKGFLFPTQISASQTAAAELQLEYRPQSSTGLAAPLTPAYTADFATAPSPAYVSKYFLGPVYLGSTELPGVLSSVVRLGINFQPAPASGSVYSTEGAIIGRLASATLTFQSIDVLNSMGSLWTKSLGSALKIYLLKGLAGSDVGRVALDQTVHVKATFAAGTWNADDVNVSGNEDGSVTVNIQATGDLALVANSAVP